MKTKSIKFIKPLLTTKRLIIALIILLTVIAIPAQMAVQVSADQYDDKIKALQQDIDAYKAESDKLNAQALTLESALAQLANQKAAIQAEINISQAKYDKLVKEIAETEKKIKDNQDALGITIANLYVDDDITPLEMLASSKTIGEYMDKQEYRNSVRDELTSTIAEVKDLKKSLETKKKEVKKVLDSQKDQKASLIAKENEQAGLLSATQGQEAEYQQLISDSQAQIAEARATQAAINARLNSTGGYVLIDAGSLIDYPWNYSNCPMRGYLSTGGADGNGGDGYGYGCRQCASYVAWRIAKETGVYYSWGNAVDFTYNATAAGYAEGAPQAGSIAVMDPAKAGQSYGHVVWVESDPYVNSQGHTVVQVSQYNYDYGQGYGMYSLMELSVGAFDHYIHIL
jgi:surface antigen/peptidoglycan hydrolase CwlO-like protein